MNKEKERAKWLAIAEKYFDATTNDNEEKALRDFLSSAESNHPAFDEIKAVMGYLAATRHIENVNAREKRAVRKKHLVHWAAAAIIAFIVGTGTILPTGNPDNDDIYVADINGKIYTDKEFVVAHMQHTMSMIASTTKENNIEEQLGAMFSIAYK